MTLVALRSEKYYIKKIICIQKECWHYNMDKQKCFYFIRNYLNHRTFHSKKHPFLSRFKAKLNKIYDSTPFKEDEFHEALRLLHLYSGKEGCLNLI